MRVGILGAKAVLLLLAVAVATPIVIDAESILASARSEIRLELADLLVGDARYWESLTAYERAKEGAKPEQLVRASAGLVRSLLQVGEFARAQQEAEFLNGLGVNDPYYRALYADALWAFGLFQEAEQVYSDILAVAPGNAGARHGLGRSLAAQGRLHASVFELQAAIAAEDRAEFFHTLGSVYRRLRQFGLAADALEAYINRLPVTRQTDKIDWARSEVRFLRSFGESTPNEIASDQFNQVHTIPFRLEREKIIVRGRVNGNDDYVDFVIDTGAEQMVMSKEAAQRAGVRPITNILSAGVGRVGLRGLESGRVETLEVNTLRVENVPTLIKNPPLTGLPDTRSENSISPLALGLSTIIDYKNYHVIVGHDLPPEPADIEMPMRFHRLAMVRGVLNGGLQRSFIVDTGGEEISISLGTANTLGMVPVRYIPLRVWGVSGWDEDAFLLPGVNLAIDRVRYENLSVVVLNLHRPSTLLGVHIGGIIGHRFLSNYRVVLDLNDSVLRLTEF